MSEHVFNACSLSIRRIGWNEGRALRGKVEEVQEERSLTTR